MHNIHSTAHRFHLAIVCCTCCLLGGGRSSSAADLSAQEAANAPPAIPEAAAERLEERPLEAGSAQQGMALTEEQYFGSNSRSICRFDAEWNLLEEKQIRIEGVNHLGAIDYHDGFLWVGLLNGPQGGKYDKANDRGIVAKIRASDLEIVQTWDITDDLTWIDPVCYDGEHLWIGDLRDLGIHRYRIDGDRLVRDGTLRYPKPMHFSQGVRIVGDKLYSIHTFGEMKGLYEFGLPETLTEAVQQPRRVWRIQESTMHLEGFDFIPGRPDEIWHAQGAQVDRYRLQLGISTAEK